MCRDTKLGWCSECEEPFEDAKPGDCCPGCQTPLALATALDNESDPPEVSAEIIEAAESYLCQLNRGN